MPKRACSVCNTIISIKSKDWKYQHDLLPIYCSRSCLLSAITSCKPTNNSYINALIQPSLDGIFYDGIKYRSGYEVSVATFLNAEGLSFLYEPFQFSINCKTYTPDFYIPEYDCFMEVKGLFGLGNKAKIKKFVEQYPDLNYIFIPYTLKNEFK